MKPKFHKKLPIVVIETIDHCMDVPNNLNENSIYQNSGGSLNLSASSGSPVASYTHFSGAMIRSA